MRNTLRSKLFNLSFIRTLLAVVTLFICFTATLKAQFEFDSLDTKNFDQSIIGSDIKTFQVATDSFAPKVDYSTGTSPKSVVVGDLNSDGKPDLAIANGSDSSKSVSVFINNGNGTFAAKVDYPTVAAPFSVAVGDFNNDGKPDLVTSDPGATGVSVLLNNGNGTFAARQYFNTFNLPPTGLVAVDFNNDMKIDIVTTTTSEQSGGPGVIVQLNNGDGTFNRQFHQTGVASNALALGDFNADGLPDLATTAFDFTYTNDFLVTLNNAFQRNVYPTGNLSVPTNVAIGDLNGDGKPDIVTTNNNSLNISVFFNNGNGTFAARVDYYIGKRPTSAAVGDFNGDGNTDLAVTSFTATVGGPISFVRIYLNNGAGAFTNYIDYPTGEQPVSVAIGDFNSDGKPDLAIANVSSGTMSVLINSLQPTAASVNISGRVLTPNRRGLTNAIVTLTDSGGNIRTARSTSFGYYQFKDVEAGKTYIIAVNSKRYLFNSQVVQVNDDIKSLDLTALP